MNKVEQIKALYKASSELCSRICIMGSLQSDSNSAVNLMMVLADIDGGEFNENLFDNINDGDSDGNINDDPITYPAELGFMGGLR